MHSNTSLNTRQFKPNNSVIQDCSKNKSAMQYDQRVYPIYSSEAVIQGRPHPFVTIGLPRITSARISDILKRNNAVFCPIGDICRVLQKECDRTQLLQMHMLTLERQLQVVVPERKVISERAMACLDEPCPICFGAYFQEDVSNSFFPVFQRCCLKAICYTCLIRYVKSQDRQMICPLCRADIEIDIARRAPLIPIPEPPPRQFLELLEGFKHKPRITEAVIRAVS